MTNSGFDRLNQTLTRLQEAQKVGLSDSAAIVRAIATIYPPKPAGSTYHRTRKLAHGWRIRLWTWTATITNKVHYAPFVQGAGRQRVFHRATGWKTERQIATEAKPQVVEAFRSAYQRAIRG